MASQKVVAAEDPSLLPPETSPYFQALKKVKDFAEILLNQQLWCLGKDINVAENNLLIRYGLERIRPPRGTSGSTNYVCTIGSECSMVLWGFGIFYGIGSNKGVYIGRYNVDPKLIHDVPLSLPIWAPSNLPETKNPGSIEDWECSFRLMSELFEWFTRYEEWVNHIMGSSYREDCLKEWGQSIVSGDEIVWAWGKVANYFRKNLVFNRNFIQNGLPSSEKMGNSD